MLLTLEIISANGEALGANRHATLGTEGATIGRSPDNDWVIADQYVSRLNVRIHCLDGAFYVEGLGLNRLAMHAATNFVSNHKPQRLRSGDRFFIGPYEIRATLSIERAVSSGAGDPAESDAPTVLRSAKSYEPNQDSLLEGTHKMPQPTADAPAFVSTEPASRSALRSTSCPAPHPPNPEYSTDTRQRYEPTRE